MFTRRFGGVLAGLLALAMLVSTGCSVDAGAAARGSLTSFLSTLATGAIQDLMNP